MSATYKAVTLVGCKIRKDKIFFKKTVRGCDHDIDTNKPYCSECGRRVWVNKNCTVEGFDPEQRKLCGYRMWYRDWDDYVLVSATHNCCSMEPISNNDCFYPLPLSPDGIDSVVKKMEERLEPLSLWDRRDFGIWTFLYAY